ncbi:hypothetical protein EI94DRAFT_1800535 [Lactarius quietus]|nr:hypothetical protein EI94DRAFT_1800535 [Lactarius quietus]
MSMPFVVHQLVKILEADDDDRGNNDDSHEQDEDAQLPDALDISRGGQYQGDDNLGAQLEVFTTRYLENLMKAFPVPSTLSSTTVPSCNLLYKQRRTVTTRTFRDNPQRMAHHPQFPWLFGPAPDRICMPLRSESSTLTTGLPPENLEILVDAKLIVTMNVLLLPTGGLPLIVANMFTQLLRALATSARASPITSGIR